MTVESDLGCARDWCAERVPEDARGTTRVELETAANLATVVEWRAPRPGAPPEAWFRREVARLRFSRIGKTWSLDWRDGPRWRPYTRIPPTLEIEAQLEELERDRCGLFWAPTPGSGGEERRRDVALA